MEWVFLLSVALTAAGQDEAYEWPLDLPRQLTSSFAEYRSGRFHAGIDLRTNGIGREVYASRAGHVTRVRCSPYGYGKAIYLQLDDGHHLVYGHLDEFYPELRDYVRKAQHAARNYTVDLYPEPGAFTVTKGQYIAKSGQTGIGAPHLHYELRDSANRPINPREVGLTWEDGTAPELRRILVAPENDQSRIDGDLKPVVLSVERTPEGRYRTRPITLHGAAGFGVDTVDPGANGNSLGVYRMRLLAGGEEHFRVQHDRLDYDNNKNGAVAYHPYLLNQGRFLLLWRWPGNVCESYQHTKHNGWLRVPSALQEVQIEVSDFHGNSATVTIPIQHQDSLEPAPPGTGANTPGTLDLEVYDDTLTVSVQFEGAETETPVLNWRGADAGSAALHRVGQRTFRYRFAPDKPGIYHLDITHPRVQGQDRTVAVAVAGQASEFSLGGMTLRVPADAPYGRLFIQGLSRAPVQSALKHYGEAWRLWPAAAPLSENITVALPAPEAPASPERTHIYQLFSGWSKQETARRGAHYEMEARRLGNFALLEDTAPPAISSIEPADGYQSPSLRPAIHAAISDSGSGISKVEIYCGDQWLLTRYDPELNHMRWEQDEDLPAGPQELRIVVSDEAGNINTVRRSVTIQAGAAQAKEGN